MKKVTKIFIVIICILISGYEFYSMKTGVKIPGASSLLMAAIMGFLAYDIWKRNEKNDEKNSSRLLLFLLIFFMVNIITAITQIVGW